MLPNHRTNARACSLDRAERAVKLLRNVRAGSDRHDIPPMVAWAWPADYDSQEYFDQTTTLGRWVVGAREIRWCLFAGDLSTELTPPQRQAVELLGLDPGHVGD